MQSRTNGRTNEIKK